MTSGFGRAAREARKRSSCRGVGRPESVSQRVEPGAAAVRTATSPRPPTQHTHTPTRKHSNTRTHRQHNTETDAAKRRPTENGARPSSQQRQPLWRSQTHARGPSRTPRAVSKREYSFYTGLGLGSPFFLLFWPAVRRPPARFDCHPSCIFGCEMRPTNPGKWWPFFLSFPSSHDADWPRPVSRLVPRPALENSVRTPKQNSVRRRFTPFFLRRPPGKLGKWSDEIITGR